jgi:uncharacterized membrane protein YccC
MTPHRLLRRAFLALPAHALNGLSVALGIACVQVVFSMLGGSMAAQLALSGAVCTSLADVPNTRPRTWHRVTAAAALSALAALAAGALRPYPVALGLGLAVMAFIASMTLAWGARAGAVSFAPVLSLVFAMALPPGREPLLQAAAWNAAGSLAYLAWALLTAQGLRTCYESLALQRALDAAATLLRVRGRLMLATPTDAGRAATMKAWVAAEAALADALQAARDFLFPAPDTTSAHRDTAMLLRVIDLRDVLLASRLDLELLGTDPHGRWVLQRVAEGLERIATALQAAAAARRDGTVPARLAAADFEFNKLFDGHPLPADDQRRRLLPALSERLRNLGVDALRIHAALQGDVDVAALSRPQLQRFVAPEGWPLRDLRAQATLGAPVLRHALRFALALGSAYFLALTLPWASHPHWLVLSVAVVLRGSLEQTLARRNARVAGTLLGCALVVVLAGLKSALWLGLVFLVAVGVAHASVLRRYWLAAAAATVMALLQAHAVNPSAGFALAERAADTVLGALLAWAFSYVLPSWERRNLPRAVRRVQTELAAYAAHVLQVEATDPYEQRLARRRAYEALADVASALQRSSAEPAAVRVPAAAVAALVDHGQRFMAHLSAVRMMQARRTQPGAAAGVAPVLLQSRSALVALLGPGRPAAAAPGDDLALGLDHLPTVAPEADVLPWLQRRLHLLLRDAQAIQQAAAALATPPHRA